MPLCGPIALQASAIAYSTTNTHWDGAYRHIRVTAARSGPHLQYRLGYYARSNEKHERRQLTALQDRQASAPNDPNGETAPFSQGAGIAGPTDGLPAAMALGAVPPTELIFNASLAPSPEVEKLDKNQPLPPDNDLTPEFKDKPYREYSILYLADAHKLKLTQEAYGTRHGQVEFVAVVYGTNGSKVNSFQSSVELNLTPDHYRQMLEHGFVMRQVVASPVNGNYFLRLGLRDVVGDGIGAMEIPVDQLKLGVAGAGRLSSNPRLSPDLT
jgi:hypothetical protein